MSRSHFKFFVIFYGHAYICNLEGQGVDDTVTN